MRLDHLNDLPEWNDDAFDDEDEDGNETWKTNPTRDACKALYQQWNQVVMMLNGALDSMNIVESEEDFPKEYWMDHKNMLLGDAYETGAKIRSSETGGIYIIRMENASIIRKNAQFIQSAMLSMKAEKILEASYVQAIRDEIDKFKELFKHWVSTFVKDEYEDEWGLFI